MELRTTFKRVWSYPQRDRWLWLGFLLAAALYYVFHFYRHPAGFPLYRHAAECVWTGQVLQVCKLPFTYPPVFAFVMLPFLAVLPWLGLLIWYAIALICTVWSCRLCEELATRLFPGEWTDRRRELLRLFAILLGLKFILAVFENQAYDLLVLPLALSGILELTDGRDVSGAVWLAAAGALKITPLIFLPYLLFTGRLAAAAVFAIAFAAFSFLPDLLFHPQGSEDGYFLTWVREVAAPGLFNDPSATPLAFWDGANPYNLSLRGAVALAVEGTGHDFLFWLRVVQIAFIASVAVLFVAGRRTKAVPVEVALLILSALMLAPMTSRTHFVGLLLPYYLIVAAVLRNKHVAPISIVALVLSFVLSGIPREVVPPAYSDFMRMHSDSVFAALILVACLGFIWLDKNARSEFAIAHAEHGARDISASG
jgi:hypothetical protein